MFVAKGIIKIEELGTAPHSVPRKERHKVRKGLVWHSQDGEGRIGVHLVGLQTSGDPVVQITKTAWVGYEPAQITKARWVFGDGTALDVVRRADSLHDARVEGNSLDWAGSISRAFMPGTIKVRNWDGDLRVIRSQLLAG